MSWLQDWLCDPCPEPDPKSHALDAPGFKTRSWEYEPSIDVTIRQSKQLESRNGCIPEEMVAFHLAYALWMAGIGFNIRYGYKPVNPPEETAHCSGGTNDWYKGIVQDWDDRGEDTNLLLTNAESGGCGQWWNEMVAVAPAYHINERREEEYAGSDRWHSNMQAALHEFAHTVGANHDHDQDKDGNQFPGHSTVVDEDEEFRYTPTVFKPTGNENKCGIPQPDERKYDHYEKVRLHEFSECAVRTFKEYLNARS